MSLAPAVSAPQLTVIPVGPVRTCIATGEKDEPGRLIRFVIGPEGDVVPDLARRLPGRGLWVRADRGALQRAVDRNLFARAARASAKVSVDLVDRVEHLLLERALADLGRARRAGRAVAGFVKVEQMIAQSRAGLLVVADGADGDGLGKLQATGLPLVRLGNAAELGGIFGREQSIYAAVARDDAGGEFIQRISLGAARWRSFRSNGNG